MTKCTNCVWDGEEEETKGPLKHCPVCGDNTSDSIVKKEPVVKKEEEMNLDLNGDGVFDKKDKSIAAKVLATKKKKRK